jgi:arginyl-tRNA synthetase
MTLNSIKQILTGWKPEILAENDIIVEWTLPSSLQHGILTTNCAFILAKSLKQNPIELADKLKVDLEEFLSLVKLPFASDEILKQVQDDSGRVENEEEVGVSILNLSSVLLVKTVGPYINLELTNKAYNTIDFDLQIEQEDDKIILEYVSNNAAKPLHAGHSRNINLGEVLRRCLLLKYPNLKTDNYWGDWGVQFGILLWGYKNFISQKTIEVTINDELKFFEFESEDKLDIDTLVAIYIWANQKKETTENFDQIVRDEFLALENGDIENERIRKFLVDISIKAINIEIGLLNAPEHDYQLGESYYAKKVPELYGYFETNQIWKSDGLARYFDLEEIIDGWVDGPEVLKKQKKSLGRCYLVSSNGYSSYAFRDIACRIDFVSSLEADKMITITANEQIHHFEQFTAILVYISSLPSFATKYGKYVAEKLTLDSILHISYGFLTLAEGKMSTRKGNILTLKSLVNSIEVEAKKVLEEKTEGLDELEISRRAKIVAVAALKWYDLARDSSGDLVLDIPKILSFEGNTGVYQLYTLARINSILRKNILSENEKSGLDDFNKLNRDELSILKHCFLLTQTVEKVIDSYKPHYLTNYLYELSTSFNSWYAKYSVAKESDRERKNQLLEFCSIIKNQLETGLDLLAINTLDEM